MTQQAARAYRDIEGLADPLELVRMTYRGGLDAVGKARQHLRHGDIAGRSREITRAGELIHELAVALDVERGGELAAGLLRLYDYLQYRLQQANAEQTDGPMAEVEQLLTTLLEGWEGCRPEGGMAKQEAGAWQAVPARRMDVGLGWNDHGVEEEEGLRSYVPGGVMA